MIINDCPTEINLILLQYIDSKQNMTFKVKILQRVTVIKILMYV